VNWFRALAAGALAALIAVILSLKSQEVEKTSRGEPHRDDTPNNQRNRPVTRSIRGSNAQNAHTDGNEEKSYRLEKRRFVFEVIAVIVIFGYTIIQGWQLWVIRDQEKRQLRGYFGALTMNFSCGDCLPTEKDQIQVLINNFGQTPLYILSGRLLEHQYLESEEFPDAIEIEPKVTEALIPHSMVVYPRIENHAQFPVNDIARLMFYDAKTGEFWLMLRGIIRYLDVFGQKWNNFFCFIYNPRAYPDTSGLVNCPRYNGEIAAHEENQEEIESSPPIPLLPEVQTHKF
jgi:hypothetical protein